MANRDGAVHVATTIRHYKGKVYKTHLLRRSYREGNKVRHETLGNLSHVPEEIVELVRAALRGQVFVPATDAFEIIRSGDVRTWLLDSEGFWLPDLNDALGDGMVPRIAEAD